MTTGFPVQEQFLYTQFRIIDQQIGLRVVWVAEQSPPILQCRLLIDQVGTLVVDEVQAIADPQRGLALEVLLTSVLSQPKARRLQVVALSAGLGEDYSHLDTWLEATPLTWTERPVPLVEGTLTPDGFFRGYSDGTREVCEHLIVRPKYDPET